MAEETKDHIWHVALDKQQKASDAAYEVYAAADEQAGRRRQAAKDAAAKDYKEETARAVKVLNESLVAALAVFNKATKGREIET